MQNLKEYLRPTGPEEAVEIKRRFGHRAVYLAGGSDILVHRLPETEVVIDIRHAGLSYVLESGDAFVIGGAALLRDAEKAAERLAGGMLTAAFRDTAPWLIRNAATVAGNIANASPAADSVPALLAVDAELTLLGDGEEHVALGSVLNGPHRTTLGDRLIRDIRIPLAAAARRGMFTKLARSHSDIAQVNMAVSFVEDGGRLRDVRIALGAVAPTAVRATETEALLEGQIPGEVDLAAVAASVSAEVSPISDWRASAKYRSKMSRVLIRRAFEQLFTQMETGVLE